MCGTASLMLSFKKASAASSLAEALNSGRVLPWSSHWVGSWALMEEVMVTLSECPQALSDAPGALDHHLPSRRITLSPLIQGGCSSLNVFINNMCMSFKTQPRRTGFSLQACALATIDSPEVDP